jgi:AcrR family transcriptional regulator
MTTATTSAAILDSVLALLAENASVTYGAVAHHAGVSRQTVYAHYPRRADLLVGAVQRARDLAGLDEATRRVFEAPSALLALEELIEIHARFVPMFLRAHVAIERERSVDPEVEAAMAGRRSGRGELAHHVATRLRAEGYLAEPWTVESAGQLIEALTSGTFTAHLLNDLQWTTTDSRSRLLVVLRRTLLNETEES